MTLDAAAEYLRCSRKHRYGMVHRGEIPAFRMDGRWRFRRESLEG